MLEAISSRLGRKIFFSYFILIIVGFLVLGLAIELAIPTSLGNHMPEMSRMMGGLAGPDVGQLAGLRAAVTESLLIATGAALLVALALSAWLTRQVVTPVRRMMLASRDIADGHYEQRVPVGDESQPDELGELALSFNQMAAQLEQTEAMRRALIGDVSHELRTPLTAIKGYMEGLMDGVLPATDETFQQVHKEADRLQRLVADLQELSRVEAANFELEKKPVSVDKLLESVRARLGRQFEEKGVSLGFDLATDLPSLLIDEDRIGQVLLNLAGNALQYTPQGGQVRLAASRQGSAVRIDVADSGVGIPVEHLPHIFNRFYRVDKSRSRVGGGSGIGLTIAKHLVEAHGGRIWAETAGPGNGSTFSFTLPSHV